MSLLSEFLAIAGDWRCVFPQQRTFQRGVRQALGSLVCLGRRCLTRIIWANGGQEPQLERGVFFSTRAAIGSRSSCFQPILKRALAYVPPTSGRRGHRRHPPARKTGRAVPQAFYQHDPLSPPFPPQSGVGSALLAGFAAGTSAPQRAPVGTRALPIRFPGSLASEAPRKESHRRDAETVSGSGETRRICPAALWRWASNSGRDWIKPAGLTRCWCWPAMAASGIALVLERFRKGWSCWLEGKETPNCVFAQQRIPRRFYAVEKFTPEQVRQDESRVWKTTKIFYGGKRRKDPLQSSLPACTGNAAPSSVRCV